MQIGSATLNPGNVTVSNVTAKIQDSAGNSLTSTAGALDVNASIDTTGLATDTGQTTGNAFLGTIAGAVSATHMQVDVLSAPTTAVTGTFWQATQPVSGSVTVSATNLDIRDLTSASDSVAAVCTNAGTFAVQATLAAETTKVIGTVNIAAAQTIGITANSSVNVAQINGVTVLMGAGNTGTGSQRVTIASDQVAVASKAAINTYVDGSIVTIGAKADAKSTATDTTAVTAMQVLKEISYMEQNPASRAVTNAGTFATQATLQTGSAAIGKLAANSGVDIGDVDVTSIAAGTNTIGAVNVKPTTTGGLDIFRSIDLDESEEEVKATAGQVFGWYIYNKAAAVTYVKFYNATAANTTVGTTTPVMTVPIPATSGANVEFTNGIAFDTAITVAATTGVADADTGAPAANDLIINLLYK